ncbi:unnamed protein product [Urochloa humidicola]
MGGLASTETSPPARRRGGRLRRGSVAERCVDGKRYDSNGGAPVDAGPHRGCRSSRQINQRVMLMHAVCLSKCPNKAEDPSRPNIVCLSVICAVCRSPYFQRLSYTLLIEKSGPSKLELLFLHALQLTEN